MIDIATSSKQKTRIPRKLLYAFMWTFIVAIWAISFCLVMWALQGGLPENKLPSIGDMATLLFGASSLALLLFSFVISAIAILGWQSIKEEIRKSIEITTHARISLVERELRGRVLTVIGFMIGAQHSDPDKLEQDKHKSFLSEAVWYLQKGYDILKGTEGRGRYMALNNLVYYTCLYGDDLKRDWLLKQARDLKDLGQELNWPVALLTYCRVICQLSTSETELRDAHSIALATEKRDLTDLQKKEAKFYVDELSRKLTNLGKSIV